MLIVNCMPYVHAMIKIIHVFFVEFQMSQQLMIHPDTGQYVLCEIRGGIATVIDENPSLHQPQLIPQSSVSQQNPPASAQAPAQSDPVFPETASPQISVMPQPSVAVSAPSCSAEIPVSINNCPSSASNTPVAASRVSAFHVSQSVSVLANDQPPQVPQEKSVLPTKEFTSRNSSWLKTSIEM